MTFSLLQHFRIIRTTIFPLFPTSDIPLKNLFLNYIALFLTIKKSHFYGDIENYSARVWRNIYFFAVRKATERGKKCPRGEYGPLGQLGLLGVLLSKSPINRYIKNHETKRAFIPLPMLLLRYSLNFLSPKHLRIYKYMSFIPKQFRDTITIRTLMSMRSDLDFSTLHPIFFWKAACLRFLHMQVMSGRCMGKIEWGWRLMRPMGIFPRFLNKKCELGVVCPLCQGCWTPLRRAVIVC